MENDYEIPTSPMVARAMLRFYRLMEKQEPGRWAKYIEFYEALVEALGSPAISPQERLLRHIFDHRQEILDELDDEDDLDN